ncbi:MAG: TolC family protein [Candidatus Omnitrophota bacterium]|nr:MAG: TolC family protein [Candidatus Omnitrophota bacterium]
MRSKLFIIVWSIFLVSPLAFGQDALQGQNPETAWAISLEEVTQLALDNSLDIQIAKYDTYIKRTSLLKAESIFDTYFNVSAGYFDDTTKQPSVVFGTETGQTSYNFGISKKLPTGTEIAINAGDARNFTNSPFATLNPYHEASAGISLKQPLGINFFGLVDRAGIKITKIDIENAEYSSLEDIEETLYNAQVAYWKFVLKCEELKIIKGILQKSRRLYDIYKEKIKIGMVEQVDLFAVEANLRVREADVLMAELEKEQAKNELLFALNIDDLSIELAPRDSLSIDPFNIDLYQALTDAVNNRRDYKRIKNQLVADDINIVVARNALWPKIDLEASFTRNGLDRKYKPAWEEISDKNNRELFVGITLKFPLEKRNSRGDFQEATLQKEQNLLSLKRTERLIFKEIHNQVKEVNALKEQVSLYDKTSQLQEKKLQEEVKRLKYGRSNSDLIIRYGEDVLDAKLGLAQVLFAYRVSLIDFELAKQTLLNRYWRQEL